MFNICFIFKNIKKSKMGLNMAEREALRKRVKNLLPQMKKSDIVKHFVMEGIASSTVYNTIKRIATKLPIKDKTRTGRPSSWTTARKARLKRLVNNRTGVSQPRLGRKFGLHQTTIGRQIKKMKIPYRKREKNSQIQPEATAKDGRIERKTRE
jgi:hypothetical protein